jgi:hypothetical protein
MQGFLNSQLFVWAYAGNRLMKNKEANYSPGDISKSKGKPLNELPFFMDEFKGVINLFLKFFLLQHCIGCNDLNKINSYR